jgi:hypothetical protein
MLTIIFLKKFAIVEKKENGELYNSKEINSAKNLSVEAHLSLVGSVMRM